MKLIHSNHFFLMFILCAIILEVVQVQAQFVTPFYVSPSGTITDEFGKTLKGMASAPGDKVVLYRALNGVIHPPSEDGTPHPDNVPVSGGEKGIGVLAPIGDTSPGIFNMSISGSSRPSNGNTLFVRVFNAATTEEASFYSDSQLFTVNGNKPFRAVLSKTNIPLDPNDNDGDGLHNSYEKSLGTSSGNSDSDEDGMSDFAEFVAGTDGTDEESYLALSGLGMDGIDLLLQWQSISGITYQAEFKSNLMDDEFNEVGNEITADGTSTTHRIEGALINSGSNYRIRVID